MSIRNWFYYVKEAFHSICRNGWMSFASVAVVAVTLFILGSFMLLNRNVAHITDDVKGQVEIVAFLDEELDAAGLEELRVALVRNDKVKEVRFVSKEEALERMREDFGDLVDGYGEERNPLRNRFEIRPEIPEDSPVLAQDIKGLPGIEDVVYGAAMVDRLFSFTAALTWVGLAFMIGLALTAMFLIANTIKLTVNARSREIKIMKYVGATEWFIRWPFLIEGLFLGFFGAVLPLALLWVIYVEAVSWTRINLIFLPLMPADMVMAEMARYLLLLGTAIGGIGSLLSMRRFLKV